jgi:hypothetical protein
MYRLYGEGMLLLRITDSDSVTLFRQRSVLIQDSSVTNRQIAEVIMQTKLAELKDEKNALQNLRVLKLDSLPATGTLIDIELPAFDVDDSFLIQSIIIDWNGGNPCTGYTLSVGDKTEDLAEYISKLKNDAATLQTNGLVVDNAVYPVEDI